MVLAVTPCQVVRVFTAQSGGDDVGVNFEIGAPSQLNVAELRPVELVLVLVVLVHGVLPLVHGERVNGLWRCRGARASWRVA